MPNGCPARGREFALPPVRVNAGRQVLDNPRETTFLFIIEHFTLTAPNRTATKCDIALRQNGFFGRFTLDHGVARPPLGRQRRERRFPRADGMRARMRRVINLGEPREVDVGVALGRSKRGVPQEFLNPAQIRSALEQVRRERMPKFVGMHVPPHAERHPCGREHFADASIAKAPPPRPEKERVRTLASSKLRPPVFQIAPEGRGTRGVKWDHPFFAAFSEHPHRMVDEVNIADVETDKFAHPQPGAIKKLNDSPIALPCWRFLIRRIAQRRSFFDANRAWQRLWTLWGIEQVRRILRRPPLFHAPFKKGANRTEAAEHGGGGVDLMTRSEKRSQSQYVELTRNQRFTWRTSLCVLCAFVVEKGRQQVEVLRIRTPRMVARTLDVFKVMQKCVDVGIHRSIVPG